MISRARIAGLFAATAWICALAGPAPARPSSRSQDQAPPVPLEKTIAVAADAGWVDTGIDLITVDQPVPNANLGALIGKVAQLVARRVDEDSGIEVRDEIFVLFLIGPENSASVPFKGRLYLGVNENVLKDNGGGYSVVVVRRPA